MAVFMMLYYNSGNHLFRLYYFLRDIFDLTQCMIMCTLMIANRFTLEYNDFSN